MTKPRVLFVYRTRRQQVLDNWLKGTEPDSKLFGLNHLRKMGYQVDFFDTAYSLFNPLHWLCYPFEHAILRQVGMGFKLDQALTLLPRINSYGVIVCTGDSSGLPFAWLKHLGIIKQPLIYMSSGLTGALKAHPSSWVVGFYKKIFQSINLVTTYAEVEREYFMRQFKLKADKVRYIPYGTDWWWWSKKSRLKRNKIVAAGIDLTRDYETFLKAVKDIPLPVEVACHPDNLRSLTIPKNVRARFLVDYMTVRRMFQQALMVIVPLKEAGRSAGQMVTLEAASAQAPLIVRGMTEAFDLRHNHELVYVPVGKPRAMKLAMQKLMKSPSLVKKLTKASSQSVKNHYTTRHLANNIGKLISLCLRNRNY